ncbi:unnamed protein product [Rhodiola kirilowii]
MEQPPPPNPPAPDLPPPQSDPSNAPTHSSSSTSLPSALISTTTTSPQNPSPNPNPNKPLTTSQSQPPYPPSQTHQPHSPNDQSRLGRPQWPQHQPSHLSHFNPSSSAASSASASVGSQRGGIAIGVPASSQSTPYSPSFGRHQFGGLGRGAASAPESSAGATTPQVRPPVSGYQTSVSSGLGSASQMRPGVISVHQQQRPAPIRSITNPNNHPINAQNLPGHSLLRGSSVGSPGLTSPSVLQSPQQRGQPQPWLVSSQGKPPLPSHTYRGHMDPQSMQQRSQSHVPQQQLQPSQGPSQPMQASSSQQQQQSFAPHQHDQFRQAQSLRPGSSLSPQMQTARGLGHPRPASFGTAQPFQPGAHASSALEDINESSNSIVSKRSIHELVNQVDPSEKLDPEVVDILVDIAEDFVDSITTFGCLLAKHRKSNTLEAKDVLLHLERNWNLTIPGFGGDEIKSYRKPVINDIHRERVAAVKNSMVAEAGSAKSLPGQQAAKGIGRAPASAMDTKP